MHKIMRLMLMSIFLLLLLSFSNVAQAWNVTIENKSTLGNITATVYSGSYFDRTEEFTKTISTNSQDTGSLSGALCLVRIKINLCTSLDWDKCDGYGYVWHNTTRCANTTVTVEQKKAHGFYSCNKYFNQFCAVATKISFKSPGLVDETIYFENNFLANGSVW